MSKKSSVNKSKKSRRRLKRSVRRTLAAVLMITAIGVAAIPVPENLATDGDDIEQGDNTENDTEVVNDAHDMSGFGYDKYIYETDKDGKYVHDVTLLNNFKADWFKGVNISELDKAGTDDSSEPLAVPADGKPNYFASYKIVDDFYDVGETVRASLNWEFMYYVATVPAGNGSTSSTGGVIFKYNDAYSASEITLTSHPVTEYLTLTQEEFDTYYSKDETDAEHIALITDVGTKKAKYPTELDPAAEITYTYDNFLKEKTGIDIGTILGTYPLQFLTEYYKDKYEEKRIEFQQYYDYDKWINASDEEKTNLVKPDDNYKPTSAPAPLTVQPSDIMTYEQKLTYLCDFSKVTSTYDVRNCELRQVHDDRQPRADSSKPGTGMIYVVYSPERGYIAKTTSGKGIVAIGDGAFKDVTNVVKLTIPSTIVYIGNEAFENAYLMTEIHIMNANAIGNRAFKGCTKLALVELAQGTAKIGAECFSNTALGTIEFPSTLTDIGAGAFSKCTKLENVKLNLVNNGIGCEIGAYAFYNCNALKNVEMDAATITKIGDGAFATSSGGSLESIVLPQNDLMKTADSLGDYLFAGCTTLKSVVFPRSYGDEKWAKNVTIPSAIFHQCRNLNYVEFPAKNPSPMYACGYANYDPDLLFIDVMDDNFYVRGPEQNSNNAEAVPRTCTWDAKTAVSDVVPYAYVDAKGTEYFEMSDGNYLQCVRKNPDGQTGVLTKCTLKPNITELPKNIDLEIKEYVGNIKLTSLADGCFPDEDLNKEVKSLYIADNSITGIGNGVFKGWPKLAEVYVGNAVNSIGNEAFAECNNLVDVTFSPPQIGYENFTIGRDAFKTGSPRLMFHGDIVKGYAPFEWATDPDNIIQEDGIRVCYKSLAPTYLTVIYNPNTELVTLLDYPKYSQVSDVLKEAHKREIAEAKCSTYEKWREKLSYEKYSDSYYDDYRRAFAKEWDATEDKTDLYKSDNYGPWINDEFCYNTASDMYWETLAGATTPDNPSGGGGNPGGSGTETPSTSTTSTNTTDTENPSGGSGTETPSGTDTETPGGGSGTGTETSSTGTVLNKFADWLFEPIVAYADDIPKPYYDVYEYDAVAYSEMTDRKPWQYTTTEEDALINATKEIVVPAGVDSIDVYGYYNNLDRDGNKLDPKKGDNLLNVRAYLHPTDSSSNDRWDAETFKMYTRESLKDDDNINSVPGLFSGTYQDYKVVNGVVNDNEQRERGNDRIISVTLNSVKYLPDYAFDSCEQLTTVNIGPDCADIGTAPFRGCRSLKSVSDNAYYKTNNGIVYSVNSDGSYTIEECLWARGMEGGVGEPVVGLSTDENLGMVSTIKDGAFEDCDNITFIDLNNTAGLTEIPARCFKNCDSLSTIWLPGTVNSIGEEAFVGDKILNELQIPGREVFISGNAFDGDKVPTTVYSSEDSSVRRYVDTYGKQYRLSFKEKDNWRVIFLDADLQQIGNEQVVEEGGYAEIPPDPVKEDWVFDKWLGTNNADPREPIHADTTFVAMGYSTSSMVDGKYKVDFMDQVDGTIFSTQLVAPGGDAIVPQAPTHEGYTFLKYGGDSLTNIQKNSIALAMYSGGTGTGTGTGGNGTTSGSSSSTQNGSTSGSSTSSSSAESRSVNKYTVTVINGSGSGSYDAGTTVIISANTPATGKVFKNWTTESAGVTFASVSLSATTFVMPENNVTVTANFVTGSGSNTTTGVSTNGNTRNDNNGNTRVDITKPGISNKDLATAKVNGSTDNFVVKISETPEATQAVMNALVNKYGNLDSVLYYAMDISLYDSTGTVQISDTTGLTVDITIPIPDALTVFGGNNMAGAVVANDQLEDLSERFSTINGVPCISFTATHFSPYTVYVNTEQLSDGALDITPKTGDPIHPKWFLSLGLACMSIILFIQKDKKPVKVKAN